MSIKIVTLGGAAAGKTIYLASLYKKLSIQNNDRNLYYQFRLKASDRDSGRFLNSTFANIVDPNRDFPSGTREFTQWNFDCQVKSNNKVYSVCQFNYLDYAGGTLNQPSSQSGQEKNIERITESINNADVIFILLDGVKIFHLLHGNNTAGGLHQWLYKDIANIFNDIQDKSIPVYFAITKWDCLRPKYGSSLMEVQEKLKTFDQFKNFINGFSHDRERIIRLIPMSSLGDGFAEMLIGAEGKIEGMRKTGQLNIKPYNVEIPIAYALLDTLITHYNDEIKKEKNRVLVQNIILKMGGILAGTGTNFLPPPLNILSKKSLKAIIAKTQNGIAPREIYENIDLSNIKGEKHAIKHLLNCFWYLTKKFENDYPGSLLNHPTWHHKN